MSSWEVGGQICSQCWGIFLQCHREKQIYLSNRACNKSHLSFSRLWLLLEPRGEFCRRDGVVKWASMPLSLSLKTGQVDRCTAVLLTLHAVDTVRTDTVKMTVVFWQARIWSWWIKRTMFNQPCHLNRWSSGQALYEVSETFKSAPDLFKVSSWSIVEDLIKGYSSGGKRRLCI